MKKIKTYLITYSICSLAYYTTEPLILFLVILRSLAGEMTFKWDCHLHIHVCKNTIIIMIIVITIKNILSA